MTAALYPCEITHVRARPVRRAFRYRSYLWLVDLDDLPQVPLALRPFARFRSRDHLGDPASSIRANVDACLARHGISLAGGRVLMLGHAAVLGYVFNPLTVFWCHRAAGTLAAVIAEVQHLRPAARVPAAPGRPRPRGDGQGLLRLTVPAAAGGTGCTCPSPPSPCASASPCTPAAGLCWPPA